MFFRSLIISFIIFTIIFRSTIINASNNQIMTSSDILSNIIYLIDPKLTVDTFSALGSCPHDYILKPSDFNKAKNAKFIIYISNSFEEFIPQLAKNSSAKLINLSYEIGLNPDANMHLWMNLSLVKQILSILGNNLNKDVTNAHKIIDELMLYKQQELANLKEILLLSENLEYFFTDIPEIQINKLYLTPGMISVKQIKKITNSNSKCIVLDQNTKLNLETIINKKIITIPAETWSIDLYKKMIDDIKTNCL